MISMISKQTGWTLLHSRHSIENVMKNMTIISLGSKKIVIFPANPDMNSKHIWLYISHHIILSKHTGCIVPLA